MVRLFYCLAFATVLCRAECNPEQVAKVFEEVRQLRTELGALKQAVAQLQLDRQQALIAELEAEIAQVMSAQAQLEAAESERQQYLREAEEQARTVGLPDDQRAHAQTLQTELAVDRYNEIAMQRAALHGREAQLRRRLREEKQLLEKRLLVRR